MLESVPEHYLQHISTLEAPNGNINLSKKRQSKVVNQFNQAELDRELS